MPMVLWIAVAGACGAVLRFLISTWAMRLTPSVLWGTFAVNVAGCFLLSLLFELGRLTDWIVPEVRLVLAAGLLGGFTTYSSFNQETIELARRGAYWLAFLNVTTTVVACLVAGAFGLAAGRLVAAR